MNRQKFKEIKKAQKDRELSPAIIKAVDEFYNSYTVLSRLTKKKARSMTKTGYMYNKIKPKTPCELQDKLCSDIMQMHHDNYLKPYDVRHLCSYHHGLCID